MRIPNSPHAINFSSSSFYFQFRNNHQFAFCFLIREICFSVYVDNLCDVVGFVRFRRYYARHWCFVCNEIVRVWFQNTTAVDYCFFWSICVDCYFRRCVLICRILVVWRNLYCAFRSSCFVFEMACEIDDESDSSLKINQKSNVIPFPAGSLG